MRLIIIALIQRCGRRVVTKEQVYRITHGCHTETSGVQAVADGQCSCILCQQSGTIGTFQTEVHGRVAIRQRRCTRHVSNQSTGTHDLRGQGSGAVAVIEA